MRPKIGSVFALILLGCWQSPGVAQTLPHAQPVSEPGAITLPAAKGASEKTEIWNMFGPGNPIVRNVTQATLTPVLPDPAHATGAAVIVAPGGGFLMLSMQTEGFAVAHELAKRGIAAFVLKYRVNPTDPDDGAFLKAFARLFQSAATTTPADLERMTPADAVADAASALKIVRDGAARWHIDPARVGMIGYSAGAMTAMTVARSADPAARPAFIGYIYGPQTIDTTPDGAPPLFDALAMDDGLFGTTSFPVVQAWKAKKLPVELHVYGSGGHGFGVGRPGQTHALHIDEFVAWLQMLGIVKPGTAP